jgi:16S rRNA (guanine527-N7)-methyltransferase
MKKYLNEMLEMNNYIVSAEIQDKLIAYLDLLNQWNKVINLTAIRDEKQSVLLHILDSLSIREYLHGERVIDVGTGAGLPGIPLALTCPDKQFVLLDSNIKKTRFLRQVMYELQIKNVEVIHSRCEDFKPQHLFDSILSRAFASIKVMLESTEHLLAPEGQFLAMKGVYPDAEIKAIPERFDSFAVHKLLIKGLDAERHLVCCKFKGAITWEKS